MTGATQGLDLATLHEAIADVLGDEPCIIAGDQEGGRIHTWADVHDRSRRLAAVLRSAGLGGRHPGPGAQEWETGQDHLGVLLHNSPEYLEAVLGAHKASLVSFNVNYRYTAEELAYLLRDARAAVLVYGDSFAPVVADALSTLDRRPLLLQVADGSGSPLLAGALAYGTALAAADPDQGEPASGPDDRYLLYTGGTTGMPKGVIWRMGDIVAGPLGVRRADGTAITDVDEAVARALKIRGRVLPAPPFMHGAGSGFALGGWLGGATVVIPPAPERLDARALVDTCEQHGVTSMCIVGDAFGAPIVEELERAPRDLRLRLLLNSGAALRDDLKRRFSAAVPGLRVTDMLGSSETGLHAKRGEGGSGGRFDGRGTATVLSDDRSRRLEPGEDEAGWLAQSGAIPMGYLGDPERTRQTFVTVDGTRWSVPGERARLAADGTIEFLGREATTINTGGEKVFADEVEQVIRSLPGVRDAVVVGRPSERWGEEVVAVYAAAGTGPADADLRDGCRARLAGYKVPKSFVLVDDVRRHANGKPDYAWAREHARAPIPQEIP